MASVQSSIFSNANIKKIQHQRYRLSVIDSINFRENWLIFLGVWGEAEVILGIWGAKEKKFQGAKGVCEINALFSGIKGAQTPLGASSLIES